MFERTDELKQNVDLNICIHNSCHAVHDEISIQTVSKKPNILFFYLNKFCSTRWRVWGNAHVYVAIALSARSGFQRP